MDSQRIRQSASMDHARKKITLAAVAGAAEAPPA
jgi:hypothetical protein